MRGLLKGLLRIRRIVRRVDGGRFLACLIETLKSKNLPCVQGCAVEARMARAAC
jgi:hypothetical protein